MRVERNPQPSTLNPQRSTLNAQPSTIPPMTAHGPDERLSAFYDGELSGVERAEVERLVTERPDLRAELSELAGLSQRLSDLADELPEVDLRSQVMQRIAAARPAPQRFLVDSGGAGALAPRRRWMPLLLTVCSLLLLVAAVWPLLPLSDRADLVANNENPERGFTGRTGGDLSYSDESGMATPSPKKSGEGARLAANDSPMMAGRSPIEVAESSASGARDTGADGALGDGTGPSEFLASLEQRRDLKPGDIVSRLIEGGDVPVIADYTVADVQRTGNHVEILFLDNGIVPLHPTAEKLKSGSGGTHSRKSADSGTRVYLVEAESTSLNTALFQCQNLTGVVALNVEPLGYGESEAQLAARTAHQKPAAESPFPSAPARTNPSPPSAVASAGASPPAGVPGSAFEGVAGKGGPPSNPAKSQAQLGDQAEVTNSVDKKLANASRVNSKLKQNINGNSLFIENGEELVTEIQQHQMQLPIRRGVPGNSPSPQGLGQSIDKQSLTQPGQKAESVESIFAKGQATQANGNLNGDQLQYGNSYNAYGSRNRQRAIVVLRTQSPPPPPEPTSLKP